MRYYGRCQESKSFLWIFDISPSANGKSSHKVRHEATNAAWSVFRTRVRGINNSWNEIKEAEGGRHFYGKNTGCRSKIATLAGRMRAGLQKPETKSSDGERNEAGRIIRLDRNEFNVYSGKAPYLRKISSRVILSGTPRGFKTFLPQRIRSS